jgi:hypothetical protein
MTERQDSQKAMKEPLYGYTLEQLQNVRDAIKVENHRHAETMDRLHELWDHIKTQCPHMFTVDRLGRGYNHSDYRKCKTCQKKWPIVRRVDGSIDEEETDRQSRLPGDCFPYQYSDYGEMD